MAAGSGYSGAQIGREQQRRITIDGNEARRLEVQTHPRHDCSLRQTEISRCPSPAGC